MVNIKHEFYKILVIDSKLFTNSRSWIFKNLLLIIKLYMTRVFHKIKVEPQPLKAPGSYGSEGVILNDVCHTWNISNNFCWWYFMIQMQDMELGFGQMHRRKHEWKLEYFIELFSYLAHGERGPVPIQWGTHLLQLFKNAISFRFLPLPDSRFKLLSPNFFPVLNVNRKVLVQSNEICIPYSRQ